MLDRECIPHDDKAASRLAPKGDDGRFDFFRPDLSGPQSYSIPTPRPHH
jgi:hypothetical protein